MRHHITISTTVAGHRLSAPWRARSFGVLVAGVATLLAACGSSEAAPAPAAASPTAAAAATRSAPGGPVGIAPTAAPAQATAIDLCSLLTNPEAAAALGTTGEMAEPRPGNYVRSGSCHYSPKGAPTAVIVWVDTSPSPAVARQEFERERKFDGGKDVSGAGEAAYVSTNLRQKIVVLSGARRLNILWAGSSRFTPEQVHDKLVALGRAAAPRLP